MKVAQARAGLELAGTRSLENHGTGCCDVAGLMRDHARWITMSPWGLAMQGRQ